MRGGGGIGIEGRGKRERLSLTLVIKNEVTDFFLLSYCLWNL